MILGFKPQFKKPILQGSKKHTIRIDKNDRWKPGMKIHFATGVRTRLYHQFYECFCKSVQNIQIVHLRYSLLVNKTLIFIDDRQLSFDEIELLAINDGFEDVSDFLNWFNENFEGKIIHWTDLRY